MSYLVAAATGVAVTITAAAAVLRWVIAPQRSFPAVYGGFKDLGTVRLRVPGGPMLQCIYPAAEGGGGGHSHDHPYATCASGLGTAFQSRVLEVLLALFVGGHRHPDVPNAPVAEVDMPVLVFSHGLFGSHDMYLQLCREVASFGVVVVAINHEDGTSSSLPKDVPYRRPPPDLDYNSRDEVRAFRKPFFAVRYKEVQMVVDYIRQQKDQRHFVFRRADLSRIALGGHSFGAASTVVNGESFNFTPACFLLYDIWATPVPADISVHTPSLSIISDQFAKGGEGRPVKELVQQVAGVQHSYFLPETRHSLWSDWAWLFPPAINPLTLWKSPHSKHHAWVEATHIFLEHHLFEGRPESPRIPHTEHRKPF